MSRFITLDRDALKARMRSAFVERIRANFETITHINTDGTLSPSRWWVDGARTTRHGLATSASASVSGTTIRLSMNYTIETL